MYNKRLSVLAAVATTTLLLISCGGGGGGTPPVTLSLTGTVSAPGGSVAFNQPTGIKRFFAEIFGKNAYAVLEGVQPAAGVTVELIRVDAAGVMVGAVIATGTTDGAGIYTFDLPTGFTLSSDMVVRAGGLLAARMTDLATANIDPVSNAANTLIVDTVSDLATLTVGEAEEIGAAVDDIAQQIEGLSGDIAAYTTAITTATLNDEEATNIVTSTIALGSICGDVTDSASAPLENIRIIVKTASDPITQAKTKTDATGAYCVNVPDGAYIIGAFNFTGSSTAASEWWTAAAPTGLGGVSQFDATSITVAGTTPVTADFQLQPGARISGRVVADSGGLLAAGTLMEGVKVNIRNFESFIPLVNVRVKADGTYRVNVPDGKYVLFARNKTRLPYASQFHDNATGTPNRDFGAAVSVVAGDAVSKDFTLKPGFKMFGQVLDAPAGNIVPGVRVRFDFYNGVRGAAARLRTNKLGNYRVWLEGGHDYRIRSRGQLFDVPALAANTSHDFTAVMVKVTTKLMLGANPVNQAKVFLLDNLDATVTVSQEVTAADGTTTLYAPTAGGIGFKLRTRIDDGQFVGSEVYNQQDAIGLGDPFDIIADTDYAVPSDWVLRAGGILKGTVYSDAFQSTPEKNIRVRVRRFGTGVGGDFFVNTRTRGDGTFQVSLPAGTYNQIRVESAGGDIIFNATNLNQLTITADQTTAIVASP